MIMREKKRGFIFNLYNSRMCVIDQCYITAAPMANQNWPLSKTTDCYEKLEILTTIQVCMLTNERYFPISSEGGKVKLEAQGGCKKNICAKRNYLKL
jgi:hypothetical protein